LGNYTYAGLVRRANRPSHAAKLQGNNGIEGRMMAATEMHEYSWEELERFSFIDILKEIKIKRYFASF
jgi:hypothetical protein